MSDMLREALELLEKCRPSHFDFGGALLHHEDETHNQLTFDSHCPACVNPKVIALLRAALAANPPEHPPCGHDTDVPCPVCDGPRPQPATEKPQSGEHRADSQPTSAPHESALDEAKRKDGLKEPWDVMEADSQETSAPVFQSADEAENYHRAIASQGQEFIWRKLLWSNHARYLPYEHTPYGDDGEMQCCGIDFLRESPQEIERLLAERSLRLIQEQKAAGQRGSK